MKLLEYTKYIKQKVDNYMALKVTGPVNVKKLYDASQHLISAGGKRLRPTLVVLGARILGLDEEQVIPAAASVELLHTFSLIHDDIMDRDEYRRGVPTVHKLWGEPLAILAGDLLFAKAYEALLDERRYGIPSDRILEALQTLTWIAITLAEGQTMDIEFEGRTDVSEDEYITMIEKKTAAMFKGSLTIGAILGGGDKEIVSKIGEFGRLTGIAFQIQDDILGIIGDEKTLGKPVWSDLREGKKTIIIIHALNNASESQRRQILAVLGKRDATMIELEKVANILKSLGSIDYAIKKAKEYTMEALEILDTIPTKDNEAKNMLKEMALFIVERRY